MLSIDEAIARERNLAEIYRNDIVPKEDYHNMPWIDMENESNMRIAKEHEQLAEWLEELKALREEKSEFQIMAKDIAEANYEMGMEIGYNKAIDDCKELTFREVVYCDSLNDRTEFRELAEQLKERNNGQQRKLSHRK